MAHDRKSIVPSTAVEEISINAWWLQLDTEKVYASAINGLLVFIRVIFKNVIQ